MNPVDHNANPRMAIQDTDLERTLRYMECLAEDDDLDEEVERVFRLLTDCWPTGTERDVRGASLKQVKYISVLAGFDLDQVHEFCRIVNLAGGMDSGQAHHIIRRLEATRTHPGRRRS